jgi:hypothetical protein
MNYRSSIHGVAYEVRVSPVISINAGPDGMLHHDVLVEEVMNRRYFHINVMIGGVLWCTINAVAAKDVVAQASAAVQAAILYIEDHLTAAGTDTPEAGLMALGFQVQ